MKTKINLIRIAALSFIIGISSCKNFLDNEIPGKLADDEFYKTDADAELAIIGSYDIMQNDYNGSWTSMLMVKIMPSDESNAAGANAADQPGYQDLDKFKTTPLNPAVGAVWEKCYTAIYRSNNIINRVNPETDLRRRIIAEALFIRAFNYFDLVTLWGDVPLITEVVSPSDYTKVGRAPKADVYALIENDLKEAIKVLPVKSQYLKKDRFRATKGAAEALLGKVYLFQQKWPEAVTSLQNVINSNEYKLANSIGEVFAKSGEFGKESIFEVSYSSNAGYDWGNFPWGGSPESNIHVQLWGPRGDAGFVKSPTDSLLGGWGMNVPKKKLYDAYVAAGDVTRRKEIILPLADHLAAGGKFSSDPQYDFEGFFQRKYGSFETQSSTAEGAVLELNYGTNWRLLRYADVVLMAAEAYYKTGAAGAGAALTLLNDLRSHRDMPALSVSGDALFRAIVTERQLELAFEGHRFLDLVRWGLAEQELGPLGFIKGKHELLPIPYNDVTTGNLTQNNY